jgi:hypothetical protein
MRFNVGDRLLCINDTVDKDKAYEIFRDYQKWVVKGREYHVREVLHNDGIVTGILLVEIYNIPLFIKLVNRVQEPAFGTFRFQKLKKDASEFFEEEKIFRDCPDDVMEKVEELLKEN